MAWKNWSDHPFIAFPIFICAVVTAAYQIYDHYYSQPETRPPQTQPTRYVILPSPSEPQKPVPAPPVVPQQVRPVPSFQGGRPYATIETENSPPASQQMYTVVYGGTDGVNVRSQPNGKLLATAFEQTAAPITGLTSFPSRTNGIPWIKVELEGWMAQRKLTKSKPYLQGLDGGIFQVIWDGGGDPNDNYISLKSSPDVSSTRIAKVYTGTNVRTGRMMANGDFEWVEAKLVGWMALRSGRGTQLLARTN
jgi:hypothetical protein